jgi:hypothetical protein
MSAAKRPVSKIPIKILQPAPESAVRPGRAWPGGAGCALWERPVLRPGPPPLWGRAAAGPNRRPGGQGHAPPMCRTCCARAAR